MRDTLRSNEGPSSLRGSLVAMVFCCFRYRGITGTFNRIKKNMYIYIAEHIQLTHNLSSLHLFNSNYSFSVMEVGPRFLDIAEQIWVSR